MKTEYIYACVIILLSCYTDGKNVLFITLDDLRPDLGCYTGGDFPSSNDAPIVSPNIDGLARKSLLMKRAYAQQAICSPSRTSFLTGRRPDTTKVFDLTKYFRHSTGNFTTIPQYFKQNGYVSIGYGKIFHHGIASGYNDPISWTEPFIRPNMSKWEELDKTWNFISPSQINEEPLVDMKTAKLAIDALQHFAPGGKYENKPFFLAVGFIRPHLPFVCPTPYQEHYPRSLVKMPPNPFAPAHMPLIAWSNSTELQMYREIRQVPFLGIINEELPPDLTKDLKRAYFSSITYADALVGDVLREIKRLGFEKNTIVSLLGDHGFHLGEHGIWGKETNFEVGTRVPFMIHVPGVTDAGIVTEKITEFVDLFPTLVDAAGLPSLSLCPFESSSVPVCTEGESLLPLMRNPNLPWKNVAFSQYPRDRHTLEVMGYSIRTDIYRYTEWISFNKATSKGNWNRVVGVELYDHTNDPYENMNRATDTGYTAIRQSLRQQLRAGWRTARPNMIG